MGQYYRAVIEIDYNTKIYESNRGLKLTEHSWWENDLCNYVSELIYNKTKQNKNTCRLAWVGDYSKEEEVQDIGFDYKKVWGDDSLKETPYSVSNFRLDRKYIVNYTKQEFLNCDTYFRRSVCQDKTKWNYSWCLHPLSLLTAIGNQRGGGDYYGYDEEQVGRWAGDSIYITDNPDDIPNNYTEINPIFIER